MWPVYTWSHLRKCTSKTSSRGLPSNCNLHSPLNGIHKSSWSTLESGIDLFIRLQLHLTLTTALQETVSRSQNWSRRMELVCNSIVKYITEHNNILLNVNLLFVASEVQLIAASHALKTYWFYLLKLWRRIGFMYLNYVTVPTFS